MYKKIYDDLLEAIEKGIYPPGSKLPSEKELMENSIIWLKSPVKKARAGWPEYYCQDARKRFV